VENVFEIKLFIFFYQDFIINVSNRCIHQEVFVVLLFNREPRQTIKKSQNFIHGPNQIVHQFGMHVVFPGRLRTFKMKTDIFLQTHIRKI